MKDRTRELSKFHLGELMATRGALDALTRTDIGIAVLRHSTGDWGELDQHDKGVNEDALRNGGRLLSAYVSKSGVRFYVITEADRSVTTVLLPSEY